MRFTHIFRIALVVVLFPALAFARGGTAHGGRDRERDRSGSSRTERRQDPPPPPRVDIHSGRHGGTSRVPRGPERPSPVREAPSRPDPVREAPSRPDPVRSSPGRTTLPRHGSSTQWPRTPVREAPSRPDPVRAAPERSVPDRSLPARPSPTRESPVRPGAPYHRADPGASLRDRQGFPGRTESRRTPVETDRFPSRTDRGPERRDTGHRGETVLRPAAGFRTDDRDRFPTRTSRGDPQDRGADLHRRGDGGHPGFYRTPGRTRVADVDRHTWTRPRVDGSHRRWHHRTVCDDDRAIVVHHYDRDWGWRGHFTWYAGFSWRWYYGYSGISWSYGRYCWPFWYEAPVCVAYVPFGFYVDRDPIIIRETVVVEQEVPVYVRDQPDSGGALVKTSEYREEGAAVEAAPLPEGEQESAPPTFDAATEKYLRDGSELFATKEYEKAAEQFRMAVIANPDAAAPKFAFGQALIALGDYPYASRVLREALVAEPGILNAPGSIVGVYADAEEFYRVLSELKAKLLDHPQDPDLLFLVVYEHYFSGDPQAIVYHERLAKSFPDDPTVKLFAEPLATRFPEFSRFPAPRQAAGAEAGPQEPTEADGK